jgi:hypothetical protein
MDANLTAQAPALPTDESGRQVVLIEDGKQQCSCSDNCPGRTTRFFSQGHDARLVTRLRNAVTAGELPIAEAFAEILKRGGTDRLQIKLDAAVANARKPKAPKKGRKAAKAEPVETFELGEFTLAVTPLAQSTNFTAKVGRWEYRGELLTYQIVEDGQPSEGDTVLVFGYDDKKGERQLTTSFSRVADEPEVAIEGDEEELARIVGEVQADTSDIPF